MRRRYDLEAVVEPLPSDRDLNFLAKAEGSRFVFKISGAAEDRSVVEAQHAALAHVARAGINVPRVVPSNAGADLVEVDDRKGRRHLARLLTFVEGRPLGDANPRSFGLLSDLGGFVGRLSGALETFDNEALDRRLPWNLADAVATVEPRLALLSADERSLVEPMMTVFASALQRHEPRLRTGIIHNDVNDYNVLVSAPSVRERRVTGLIDFGDMLRSFIAAEVAVAAAYGILHTDDPLRSAAAIVSGYHERYALTEAEVATLFPFMAARLCVSICMSADQSRMEPDNEYLLISREPALDLLRRLRDIHPSLAEGVFRHACGFDPSPAGTRVAFWLRSNRDRFEAVVKPRPSSANALTLDFSTTSVEWTFAELTEPRSASREIYRVMDDEGARVGVGRYGEVRLVYRGSQFRTDSESRTVHLGIDLFQPPGSTVRAPLEGTVHSVADNDLPFDYGPTVILRHDPVGGPTFYTLYGHLSRKSIDGLEAGQAIEAGAPIGAIGDEAENGGWAPHVHVQIIADLLGRTGEYPGVAAPWARDVWMALSPDPGDLLGVPAEAPPSPSVEDLLADRIQHVGPSLSVSYEYPVAVHRGHGTYLYDRDGQALLDTVNNVAHVGHCHPAVVEAVSRQMRVLNTNTRYLYDLLGEYAGRLAATLPPELSVCYFVNSGSEANDLALRLARAYTRRKDVMVIDHAYHGNLSSLIEISPYKFAGPGGVGRPRHVHVVPMPDPYRDGRGATAHVDILRDELTRAPVAAFFAESAMGCGGQVFFPDGYLRGAFEEVRRGGGVCISDEVQTGLGRVGDTFWAFELQDGAVPDIVTMGKPIGNGHPLGAVVTTREIAESFDTGMEYFNTFGGNPVSCAAGLAVLDIIEREGLQEHARQVGSRFLAELQFIRDRHEIVGDVRGRGLFLGVELVRDRAAKEPAGDAASYVVERMRELGILASTDGPFHNVIKIKPPLAFGADEADRYVEALDRVLAEDYVKAACT